MRETRKDLKQALYHDASEFTSNRKYIGVWVNGEHYDLTGRSYPQAAANLRKFADWMVLAGGQLAPEKTTINKKELIFPEVEPDVSVEVSVSIGEKRNGEIEQVIGYGMRITNHVLEGYTRTFNVKS